MHKQPCNKDIYQYFRMGVVTGLVAKEAVIGWADQVLTRDPNPDFEIIELSLSGKVSYSQLVYLLSRMQGAADYDLSLKMLLAQASKLFREKHQGASEMILGLRLLNAETFLPEAVRADLNDLDHLNEAYRQGQVSSEAISARLSAFLEPYAGFEYLLEQVNGQAQAPDMG